ncbi:MAG: ankyrin repeat domain-containing protein [Gammaproteobacteria bacterium]|nr:ankyrin repeat domain-containing protein [Gammaproteobacteria bacterium]
MFSLSENPLVQYLEKYAFTHLKIIHEHPLEDWENLLVRLDAPQHPPQERELFFLSYITHPALEDINLIIEIYEFLLIAPEQLFFIGILSKDIDFFNFILAKLTVKNLMIPILNIHIPRAVEIASKHACIDILQTLCHLTPLLLHQHFMTICLEAAKNGHLQLLEFISEQAPFLKNMMVFSNHYELFRTAAEYNQLHIIKYLFENHPLQIKGMITANHYEGFTFAAKNGNLNMMFYFYNSFIKLQSLELIQFYFMMLSIFQTLYFFHLSFLPVTEHVDLGDHYISVLLSSLFAFAVLCFYKISPIFYIENQFMFLTTLTHGHLDFLKWLFFLNSLQQAHLLSYQNFLSYRLASKHGYLEILKLFESKCPRLMDDFMPTKGLTCFLEAAQNGHIPILDYYLKYTPDLRYEFISNQQFSPFREAALYGHLDTLKYLIAQAPEYAPNMILSNQFLAFRNACRQPQLEVVKFIFERYPAHQIKMIEINHFEAIESALSLGFIQTVDYLQSFHTDNLFQKVMNENLFFNLCETTYPVLQTICFHLSMQQTRDYLQTADLKGFKLIVKTGELRNLIFLFHCFSTEEQEELALELLKDAIKHGHLHILIWLESKIATTKLSAFFDIHGFNYCCIACTENHITLVNHLLEHPTIFNVTCAISPELTQLYIVPFVMNKILWVKKQRQLKPDFDLDATKVLLFYNILIDLIHRNSDLNFSYCQILISLPSIRQICIQNHRSLLRLVAQQQRLDILNYLFEIDEIAQHHHYETLFSQMTRATPSIQSISEDHESSMKALSPWEESCYRIALRYYIPQVSERGIDNVISELHSTLKNIYHKIPASFYNQENQHISLPLSWEDFINLRMSPTDCKNACVAYYKHPAHTALRYLSKPNQWIHPQAKYALFDSNHPEKKWAYFEDYLPMIALLFFAVIDASSTPTEDHTLEGRLHYFISGIAGIGRAHNWDNSHVILNSAGQLVEEEYDDLCPDQPSCYSGVKKRLFQSIIGHSLFMNLNPMILKAEMNDFIVAHYQKMDLSCYRNHWINYIVEPNDADLMVLKDLDLSPEPIKSFLTQKYGVQFSQNKGLIKIVEDSMKLKGAKDATILNFGHLKIAGLTQINDDIPVNVL